MTPGLVSTIIPVHNRPDLLGEAVNSVLAQHYRPLEIIVVDDGSTDRTPAAIAALCREHPALVKSLRTEQSGPGLAREAGRQAAQGEFIQYLDSDDLLLPRKFEVQVAALMAHPACGIAYGITRLVDESGAVLEEPLKLTGQARKQLFPALLVERWWSTHTPLWRRSVCDRIGPWSDMWDCEDWEYDARAAALGIELVHCPEVLSATRQHPATRLSRRGFSPALMRDRCRMILALDICARQAGVDASIPEMAVFSRWAFLTARQAGAVGLGEAAAACFAAALRTAGPVRARGFDFRVYRALSALFGWRFAGRASGLLDRSWFRGVPGDGATTTLL